MPVTKVTRPTGGYKEGDIVFVDNTTSDESPYTSDLIRTKPVPVVFHSPSGTYFEDEDLWWPHEIRLATEVEIIAARLLGEI